MDSNTGNVAAVMRSGQLSPVPPPPNPLPPFPWLAFPWLGFSLKALGSPLKACLGQVLLFGVGLVLQTVLASSSTWAIDCNALNAYRTICQSLTSENRCSRELTETCCVCQPTWSETFDYCSFQVALRPTPFPTATPTSATPTSGPGPTPTPPPGATPTPVRPLANAFTCELNYDATQSFCLPGSAREYYQSIVRDRNDAVVANGLTYAWSMNCRAEDQEFHPRILSPKLFGGIGTPLPQNAADLNNPATVVLTDEPPTGRELLCDLTLRVNRGTETGACTRRIAIENCALGCNSYDVRVLQVALDSHAHEQKLLVETIVKRVRTEIHNRKYGTALLKDASTAMTEAWQVIWAFPQVFIQCANKSICVSISTTTSTKIYSDRVQKLYSIAKQAATKLQRSARSAAMKRKATAYLKTAKIILGESLDSVSTVPTVRNECH